MTKDACFQIGFIAKPHGLKGELNVTLTQPLDVEKLESVFVEHANQLIPYFISAWSKKSSGYIFSFDDIHTVEQAKTLKGCALFISNEYRPQQSDEAYFDDQIIGSTALDKTLGNIGKVDSIVKMGSNFFIQIRTPEDKEILIPKNSPFVTSYNPTNMILYIDLPDGFLEVF